MLASIVFLTPLAALVALALLLPLAAFVIAERRVSTVRRLLSLEPPRSGVDVATLVALAAVIVLLALVAAQPALSRTKTQRVRTDAAALFVVDVSQSMAASSGPTGRTRLARALADAARLRRAIPGVPSGVATLTDRVLPNLLPVGDPAAFDSTLTHSLAIEEPPPKDQSVRATSFGALGEIPSAGFFDPSAKHRTVVLLTDGESAPFDASAVGRALGGNPGTKLLTVQLWRPKEAIYSPAGRVDPSYRPDPSSKDDLARLAAATHGEAFTERQLGNAASSLKKTFGAGPTRAEGRTRSTHPLAPYLALLALLPLAFILRGRGRGRGPAPPAAGITYR
jgi:hypothetical protein